jgi:transcriptional regulator with GAF, ATPase, and Fis domain
MPREGLLARTLVELADTLVADFDVVDLLALLTDRCVDVLDVGAAGLMLVAPEGDLRVMASSSETMRVLELFELQSQEGPCLDCYRTGQPVANHDLAADNTSWPRFAEEALAVGFHSVNAVPMRLRGAVIGALNLFHIEPLEMVPADLIAAQVLADVATIAILQHRAALQAHVLSDQLQYALNSRVAIEQAKGMIAERDSVNMEEAFFTLRNHAPSQPPPRAGRPGPRQRLASGVPTRSDLTRGPRRASVIERAVVSAALVVAVARPRDGYRW